MNFDIICIYIITILKKSLFIDNPLFANSSLHLFRFYSRTKIVITLLCFTYIIRKIIIEKGFRSSFVVFF